MSPAKAAAEILPRRVRDHLCAVNPMSLPVPYHALAKALDLAPPNTIHQLTVALECLIQEDIAASRPLIAAFVISKARGGLPGPGFFDCARRFGRFDGDPLGPDAAAFHATEFDRSIAFWHAPSP